LKGIGKILVAIFFAVSSLAYVIGNTYELFWINQVIGLILCIWGLVDLHRKPPGKDEEPKE
jgi:hypothetical protein